MATPGGFHLLTSGTVEDSIELPISSNAVTQGDLMTLAVGATTWSDGAATLEYWQLKAIATETVASTATVVKATLVVSLSQQWACETANNSAAADNGDRMILSDANTVNNTGTDDTSDDAVVIQRLPMGAASDKRIIGWIVPGSGVNPDAT